MSSWAGRMRELSRRYGKVALGVHLSVSAVSIAGFYTAINNNVDVESFISKIGVKSPSERKKEEGTDPKKKGISDYLPFGGGALVLAILCNKCLFPVRVPITIALTPPIARFLGRRNAAKNPPLRPRQ